MHFTPALLSLNILVIINTRLGSLSTTVNDSEAINHTSFYWERSQTLAMRAQILYGELAMLLTAMRNRAHQPAVFIYPESDEESEKDVPPNEGFLFEDERRFPVLVVSVIGIQHARIFYACMDDLDVVIRHSRIWSLEKKDEEVLDFLAGMLLSGPLDGNLVEALAEKLGSTTVFQEKESDGYVLVDLFEGEVP